MYTRICNADLLKEENKQRRNVVTIVTAVVHILDGRETFEYLT